MTDRASTLLSLFGDPGKVLGGHYRGPGALQGTPQMISSPCPQPTSLYDNDFAKLSDVLICNSLANQWGALWLPWCRSAGAPWYRGEFQRRQVENGAFWFLSRHPISVIWLWAPAVSLFHMS